MLWLPPPHSGETPTSLKRSSLGARRVTPLQGLNPYNGGWTVRVRAMAKSALRRVKTKRGELAVFDVEFTDEQALNSLPLFPLSHAVPSCPASRRLEWSGDPRRL